MSNVIIASITMTSLELVDFINEDRKARAESVGAKFPSPGFAKLEHADFLKKVPLVLGREHAGKFSETVYRVNPSGGRPIPSPGYRFPKREACLMAMSYSYELQAKVFDRMTALEQSSQIPTLPNFSDPVAAARAWADAKEGEQNAVAQLALVAPKVTFFDKVVERTTLMTATQIAQKLGMSAIKLNKHLDELGIYAMGVKRARVFKQWVIDKGYGELKQTELGYSQPLFTTAGEAWIVERLTSEGVA
ncbi:phage antirepressor KilAC domain-containing protein [Comamonas thiooxydans]|uniref:phage antirepressor KilAC domain-containing protein n=1 Tax=Comamonas thiooxydans TaxID=363952 RepID=UPI002446C4B0|nr:phage antirepressor KilAC domain-containing protein [Comamonas thiooxydans]MDH1475798.1 phage antirepressor KilAC domain-containing protein [Comamonas thiooxydans]